MNEIEGKINSKTVYGSRLQVTCRSLGLYYKEVGEWVKNSNRHYPDRWAVTGVELSEADAQTLQTYLDNKRAKEQAKYAKSNAACERRAAAEAKAKEEVGLRPERAVRGVGTSMLPENKPYFAWFDAFNAATERYLMLDADYAAEKLKAQKRRDSAAKREAKELAAITSSVTSRWLLDAADVTAFAEHANEPGEGRVVRTRTACREDFDTKVYMALVAWVRHNKTVYDDERRDAKDTAYAGYLEAKEWGADRDERADLLDEARDAMQGVRNRLHAKYTAEAVAWLKERESKTPQGANPAASVNSSDESASTAFAAAQPMAEVECSVAHGQ